MYEAGDIRVGRTRDGGKLPVIHLPHSCDEWVIGGVKEAAQMIVDLTKAIERLLTDECKPCAEVSCPCRDGDPCHFSGDVPMEPAHRCDGYPVEGWNCDEGCDKCGGRGWLEDDDGK